MFNNALFITIVIVILALSFDFINGFHDTANAIATTVATRVMSPRQAIFMAACLNLVGALIMESVAKMVGKDIVDSKILMNRQDVLIAALLGAIIWNLITWYKGIPSSSSHAIIGGLIGSSIALTGTLNVVGWSKLFTKVVIPLIASPILGLVIGFLVMTGLNWILRKYKPATVTKIFSKAQIVSAAGMAFNHGANDAQKSMGIIALALFLGGHNSTFSIPLWVKLSCAISMALGTSIGGYKIIKTMGMNMAKLAPVNGFAAETTAASIILGASLIGAPVSTTHIISTSIMGVGAAKRFSAVRWSLARSIVKAWVITIPICAGISALIMLTIQLFV